MPPAVERALVDLGKHLHVGRRRRKQSMAVFAERIQVSLPTLRKMERGDPSVSIAVYAMALWVLGRVSFLSEIADPATDEMALLLELRNIQPNKRGRK